MAVLWGPALISALVASVLTPVVIFFLQRWKVVDVASGRSSHIGVATRGVGVATLGGVVAGISVGLTVVEAPGYAMLSLLGLGSLLGAVLGLVEDIRGLPVSGRAGVQVILGLGASAAISFLTPAPWWWVLPAALFIAGYINAANFMDGLNGISGIHGGIAGMFYVSLGFLVGKDWLVVVGAILAASFLVFLPWNLLRDGTFLGDSGSYLLGSLIALIAVAAWMSGVPLFTAFGPTIIYCIDTGGTLLRRVVRNEKWYEPHKAHVYQRLTVQGMSHVGASALVGLFTLVVAAISLVFLLEAGWVRLSAIALILGVCGMYWLLPRMLNRFSLLRGHDGRMGVVSK